MENYGVVLVTVPTQDEGEAIAKELLEAQLAACISMTEIRSIYRWEGEVCSDLEWQLIIKTNLSVFSVLEAKIQELHSYEVPEIIALPITVGSQSYLNWIGENVNC
ncbi:MAG: divalent-cation tolerance protein CutA [Jaaginema sp. PMC 1079.18]|nr:divalent-cation tolerance protein CutA [Jaaginema sp. PMC 1080.18]MEC4849890.1 divalent-cation tolerance protein CutA [Jaaginema sp. PMC 1079.18]MEC4866842.1 divalent-cation tolerance protein CutA [Jaaginema sp. PMC 1078.18]